MTTLPPNRTDADQSLVGDDPSSRPGLDRQGHVLPSKARWHPNVRLVLILMVLPLMLSTGFLTRSGVTSSWTFRTRAQVVAADAAQLEVIASARAQVNPLAVPMTSVAYAAGVGISEPVLDTLLHPAVPFRDQLAQGTARLAGFPTFQSTPVLRADVAEVQAMIPKVVANKLTYDQVMVFIAKMETDLDAEWYRAYDQLQAHISAWQPPGTFEVHASALRQAYQAFLSGGSQVGGAVFALEGTGPADAKQQLIAATGEFQIATAQFSGHLGPKAQKAWSDLQNRPADRHFAATIQQGLNVAIHNLAPPFLGNLDFASSSMTPGLLYLADLNQLVISASQDLRDSALTLAREATRTADTEIAFLVALALVSLAGVAIAGRVLTRPLQRLAVAARQVHDGEFALEPLPATGPREVVTTTAAFNDMAATLKAVESRVVALAAEDLSHPELQAPLPGRTGKALQATVDALAARIGEREQQRQLLHQEATHDRLTGLFNRAAVFDYLTNDVSRRRQAGETVAVLFIDLDGLKPLNDKYGHEVGDTAITVTAEVLLEATNACDVVGRLGGDEFLVVLCHNHSSEGSTVAERIHLALVEHSLPAQGFVLPLQASVGVALAQCDTDTDPMELVRRADKAMYEAKRAAHAARDQMATSTG